MDNKNTTKYVIDANILMYFGIFIPRENHIEFWARMSRFIEERRIILLRDIADECKREPLKSWVQEQRQNIITPSDVVRRRAIAIENKYKLTTFEKGKMKSEADPVIIAYAEQNQYAIFSYETKRKPSGKSNKIPDVCKVLKVKCERQPYKVLKEIEFGTIGKNDEIEE